MRVSIVNTLYSPFGVGGAGRSVRELAEALALDGHDVEVNTLAASGYETSVEELNGVVVRRFLSDQAFGPFDKEQPGLGPVRKTLWHAQETHRAAAKAFLTESFGQFRPDVVHTNNIAGFGLAAWSAASHLPLVHTMRDYYLVCVRSQLYRNGQLCEKRCTSCTLLKAPVRVASRTPDVYVGVSQDLLDRHSALGAIPAQAASAVVHNWPSVLPREARPSRPAELPFRFGVLGRIGEDKGTWKVVEGFRAMPETSRRQATLVIAGSASASDERRLREIEEEVPEITYLGTHVEPLDFFDAIDMAVIPSQWYEPFGRVAAEARLAGVDVLASRVGGLPEALEQFGGGVLVEDFSSTAGWADAMARAAQVRRPVVAFHPVARPSVGEQYLALYESASSSLSRG